MNVMSGAFSLDHKSLSLELKADSPEGSVQAVFSTFNDIDLDNDVTLPGAFEPNAPVKIAAWGHNWGALPVGKGTIQVDAARAVLDGQFILTSSAGKDTYETLKELGPLAEWSYGFDVLDSELGQFRGQSVRFLKRLKVYEVSPVMVGAGIGTQTLDIKGLKDQLDTDPEAVLTELKTWLVTFKEGRVLSAATRERLSKHPSSLRELADDIDRLLEETAPPEKGAALWGEFQRILARQNGVAV